MHGSDQNDLHTDVGSGMRSLVLLHLCFFLLLCVGIFTLSSSAGV
jgi:hypothetical protein